MLNDKKCVYTALLGDYEKLNEQEVAKDSDIDFLCFTDNKDIRSETWQIIQVEPIFPFDLIRSARTIKVASHRFLPPEYATSLYIDNGVTLKVTPEEIFKDFPLEKFDLHLFKHSFRETVFDEFEEVLRIDYDKPNVVVEQLNAYSMIDPDVFTGKPYWTGFMVRNHNKQNVINMMEDWLAQIMRYSRRDQLSINYVIHKHNLPINELDFDNHTTVYHQWPTAQRFGTPVIKKSLADLIEHNCRIEALMSQIKNITEDFEELEIQFSEKQNHIEHLNARLADQEKIITHLSTINMNSEQQIQARDQQILNYALSKSWRITRPLRKLMAKIKGSKNV